MSKKYYAVKKGLRTGVFDSWQETKECVAGISNAVYKSFKTLQEAENYLFGDNNTFNNTEGLNIFVDGSYSESKNVYAWSFVIIDNNDNVIHKESGIGRNKEAIGLRNVAGELSACMRAARYIKDNNQKGIIHYDYAGIANWCNGYWETKNNITKTYKEYMQKYKDVIGFVKVKGHSGILGNEIADSLCTQEINNAA